MVVAEGLAVGIDIVAEVKPVDGDQEYVFPATAVVPIAAPFGLSMHVLVKSEPALAIGTALSTVTIT